MLLQLRNFSQIYDFLFENLRFFLLFSSSAFKNNLINICKSPLISRKFLSLPNDSPFSFLCAHFQHIHLLIQVSLLIKDHIIKQKQHAQYSLMQHRTFTNCMRTSRKKNDHALLFFYLGVFTSIYLVADLDYCLGCHQVSSIVAKIHAYYPHHIYFCEIFQAIFCLKLIFI